jgi:hypothetical protein
MEAQIEAAAYKKNRNQGEQKAVLAGYTAALKAVFDKTSLSSAQPLSTTSCSDCVANAS